MPPRAVVRSLKPAQSMIARWSMWMPVSRSTVDRARLGPPYANAALILPKPLEYGIAVDLHPGVTRDRDELHGLPVGRDVGDHQGVAAVLERRPLAVLHVVGDGLGLCVAVVGAEQQDVQRLVVVLLARDLLDAGVDPVDVADLVVEVPEVAARRAREEGEDQGERREQPVLADDALAFRGLAPATDGTAVGAGRGARRGAGRGGRGGGVAYARQVGRVVRRAAVRGRRGVVHPSLGSGGRDAPVCQQTQWARNRARIG